MKLTPYLRATLLAFAFAATLSSAHAQLSYNSGYSSSIYYTDPSANSITGFNWDSSSNLYYLTANSDFSFGGFYKVNSALTTNTNLTPSDLASGAFSGTSVVTLGSRIYFNDGSSNLYLYNTGAGSSAMTPSSMPNYALFTNGSQLFFSGSVSTTNFNNQISFSGISPTDGSLVNNPSTQIETDTGASGPLTFDSAGNMYYAPGFGSTTIYKWSAAQVAVAMSGGAALTENSASLWYDYSGAYSSYAGGTGLAIDGNQLLVSLTSFSGPSALVAFGINGDGTAGSGTTLITNGGDDSTFLNQLQVSNGNIFISDSDQIIELQAVPEPSSIFLLALGLAGLIGFHFRRTKKLAPVAALITPVFFSR